MLRDKIVGFMYTRPHTLDMGNLTPTDVAEKIGHEYVERDTLPFEDTPTVERVYNRIAGKVWVLYNRIPVTVVFQEDDPYDDYEDMAQSVAQERTLRVYNQHTDHPVFNHQQQLRFRAVHDWHGHLKADVDFSPEGEYKKWEHMCGWLDTETEERVMLAEVVGQVGAVHYLEDGFADERYEQRAFMAPKKWMWDMEFALEE